jgi:zinc finger SWIM domain-containing protein 3
MENLKNTQNEECLFFYAMEPDDDSRIMNIFSTDGQAIIDDSIFQDVASFDITFSIGVNHHKQTLLFTAVLLYNEAPDSFEWHFRTFLQTMSGR